jgi:tetratricopeptide (TPR) repeat protein
VNRFAAAEPDHFNLPQVSIMQQYRVNYPLLIGLAIGTLVCSGAVYGLWRFQIERTSYSLIREAKKAHEERRVRDATQFYTQYLTIHPEDWDTKVQFANAQLDVTELDDATIVELGDTMRILETFLRNPEFLAVSESKNVRRRLIGLYGRDSIRNFDSALAHINLMLDTDPKNTELQVLRATYLARSNNLDEAAKYSYQLIGYDPKTDKFDAKKATAANEPQVYSTLANIVRTKYSKPELAERIVDQMVDVNPKSAEAYLQRGRLRTAWGNEEGARADAAKAYELKPEDTDALLFAADVAAREEQFDKANEYIEKAKKLHPNEVRLYQAAAALAMKQYAAAPAAEKKKHYDTALAQIEEGIKKVSGSKALDLLFFKVELQIPVQDIKGARQTIEQLQQVRNLRPEVIDYFDGKILLAEQKWFQAMEALNRLRSTISEFGRERKVEVDYNLGLCYEHLGRFDMARQQYDLVLQADSNNEPAKAGLARVAAFGPPSGDSAADPLQKLIADELKKPKTEQDWTEVEKLMDERAKKNQLDETTKLIFRAQIMMMREEYDNAAKLLAEAKALSPKNLQVRRLIIQLARMNSKIGPDRAGKLLESTVAEFGDLPALRIDKADILIQLNKDQQDKEPLKHALADLFTGIDKWTTAQKVDLWSGMGAKYLGLGMMDEARQYLTLSAENQPNELPLRLALFSLALEAGDDAGMKDAQDKILQVVGDQNDSAWLYTEARRKMLQYRRNRSGPEALEEIRKLVNQALRQRSEWFELHALLGEIELLANNRARALEHYDSAERFGRPAPSAVATHIRLLTEFGRYADAAKLIDRIPEQVRQQLLGGLYAELLFRSNQTEAALKQARAAIEADPKNAQNHYWYAHLLARSAQASDVTPQRRNEIIAEAIKAMQQATELQPEFPEAWFALINYNAMQNNLPQAQKAMRDAQLALSGDNLQLFLARSYEVLHRWFDAETLYRAIYETAPDDLGRAQQLAAFYTGPIYQRPDRREKATPLINQILRAGAEKKVPANDANLLWARRMAAKMYAATNEYQNLVKAEKLLASNSQDGSLLIEDKLALAEILAARPEPRSRLTAIGLLEEVDKVQRLNEQAQIQLAELYFAVGSDWGKYERQMDLAISRFPNSIEAREKFVRKLLARGDQRSLDKARTHVNELRRLAPNNPATFELIVRLAGKLGRQQEVRSDLLKKIPNIQDLKDLDAAKIQSLAMFAGLLIELGDLDSAEKIYTDLAARNPAIEYELARFLGLHRDPERCFAKLNEVYKPANVQSILSIAMQVVRERRDKVGDKFDADIQRWLDAGLRENPDSIPLMIVQADFYDLQKKYQEAAEIHRKLLARNDLKDKDIRRAVVLNNLAFLLALDKSAMGGNDKPLQLVQEAVEIMGPNSDILDTRAVVLISQNDFKGAIRDLELSVTDSPTASKYFHKALAHYNANEKKAAVDAWTKAEALGLSRDALNRMEHDKYEDLKIKIDQIRKPTVTRADSPRKAG